MSTETKKAIDPKEAIELLKKGNVRFLNKNMISYNYHEQVAATSGGQYPFAAVLGCIDSRVPAEIVFDQGIGDIFNVRIAGNFVNDDILGSLEFACKVAGSKVIVVLGHTSCGAIKGACDNVKLGKLTGMLENLTPAVNSVTGNFDDKSSGNAEFVQEVALNNIKLTIGNIKSRSAVLNEMVENNEIEIIGAIYDVKTGEVSFLDH